MILAGLSFPDPGESTSDWKPTIIHFALARDVLAAAITQVSGHWVAYIKSVPGHDHEGETEDVLWYGMKLPEDVARAIFPQWKEIPWKK